MRNRDKLPVPTSFDLFIMEHAVTIGVSFVCVGASAVAAVALLFGAP